MLKFVFLTAFVVFCHAAPFPNKQLSADSQPPPGLNRPTPINPDIPSDPKPDEKITLIKDEVPKHKRESEQDKEKESHTNLGPINLKDQQEREELKQAKHDNSHTDAKEVVHQNSKRESTLKLIEAAPPEPVKVESEQEKVKQNKRDTTGVSSLSDNSKIPCNDTMTDSHSTGEHQKNKRESTEGQQHTTEIQKNDSTKKTDQKDEENAGRSKRQYADDVIHYQICGGRKVRRADGQNSLPINPSIDIVPENPPLVFTDEPKSENENKKPCVPANDGNKQKRETQDTPVSSTPEPQKNPPTVEENKNKHFEIHNQSKRDMQTVVVPNDRFSPSIEKISKETVTPEPKDKPNSKPKRELEHDKSANSKTPDRH